MDVITRRAFLKVAGVAGLALVAGCRAEISPEGDGSSGAPDSASVLSPVPIEILITPTGELYTQSYSSTPRIDPATWQLTVDGLVDRPLTLGYAELASFAKVESQRTLECIGNPVGGSLIGNPIWGGFRAQEIWDRVRIRPEAVRAKFTSADDYQTSVDLRWITQPDVLFVYEINGGALPAEHGFPLRILMPGLYGQKMPKWLTHIEFIPDVFLGYWESRGWSDEASVQTNSIIRQPRGLGPLPLQAVPVFGVAFAGLKRITSVEVRIDQGSWQPAQLLQDPSPLVWTQWSFDWPAEAGTHRIAVRATDETGFTQSSEADSLLAGAFPDGADDIHSVVVRVEG
jgi:DMSO/TMAO reductase YedYZ molybdopterin-dependent catalytic subunit